MKDELIALCGMNCGLCISYQFRQSDLNKKGFRKRYCPGCMPRSKNCTYMGDSCELVGQGRVRFCYECDKFPCKRLKILDFNETQSGVLNLVFRIADDQNLLLLDLKDLKTMLVYVADNAKEYTVEYGTVSWPGHDQYFSL